MRPALEGPSPEPIGFLVACIQTPAPKQQRVIEQSGTFRIASLD